MKLQKIHETILYILLMAKENGTGDLSKFQIVKLLYLIQIESLKFTGRPFINNLSFFREKNGPLSADIYYAINDLKDSYISITTVNNEAYGYSKEAHSLLNKKVSFTLTDSEILFLRSVLSDYLTLTQAKLKDITYKTEPMVEITSKETNGNILRKMLDYGSVPLDKDVAESFAGI